MQFFTQLLQLCLHPNRQLIESEDLCSLRQRDLWILVLCTKSISKITVVHTSGHSQTRKKITSVRAATFSTAIWWFESCDNIESICNFTTQHKVSQKMSCTWSWNLWTVCSALDPGTCELYAHMPTHTFTDVPADSSRLVQIQAPSSDFARAPALAFSNHQIRWTPPHTNTYQSACTHSQNKKPMREPELTKTKHTKEQIYWTCSSNAFFISVSLTLTNSAVVRSRVCSWFTVLMIRQRLLSTSWTCGVKIVVYHVGTKLWRIRSASRGLDVSFEHARFETYPSLALVWWSEKQADG
jgi:hypothetical protein